MIGLFYGSGDLLYQHLITHTCPTRLPSYREARRHLRRVEADDAATDDADLARRNARDAAQEHTATAVRLFECGRTRLDRHAPRDLAHRFRTEEHTSDLQSLMRISSAVFCLKKQNQHFQT